MPCLWNRERLYSLRLVAWHFWIATLGIVLYITAMWVSGIMQGLMWRAYDELGFLQYSFVETVEAMHPFYVIRALGGVLFLTGALIMVYNLWRTIRGDIRGRGADRRRPAPRRHGRPSRERAPCGTSTRSSRTTAACSPLGSLVTISIGGLVEIVPLFTIESDDRARSRACGPTRRSSWPGRNIYVREGCYVCH